MPDAEIPWVSIGRFAAGAIIDGAIYALLYWSEGFAAADGEALSDSGAGWFLVFVHDPNAHLMLGPGLPLLQTDSSTDEIGEAIGAAVPVARHFIRQRLDA
jgi:hypothetical protein